MRTETITITLPEADAKDLRDMVNAGEFVSNSEAIHHALNELRTRRSSELREERLAIIREKFAKAAANPGRISIEELGRMLEQAAAQANSARS